VIDPSIQSHRRRIIRQQILKPRKRLGVIVEGGATLDLPLPDDVQNRILLLCPSGRCFFLFGYLRRQLLPQIPLDDVPHFYRDPHPYGDVDQIAGRIGDQVVDGNLQLVPDLLPRRSKLLLEAIDRHFRERSLKTEESFGDRDSLFVFEPGKD